MGRGGLCVRTDSLGISDASLACAFPFGCFRFALLQARRQANPFEKE
jgi:hypothetical protein